MIKKHTTNQAAFFFFYFFSFNGFKVCLDVS
jgi:hypothetical protein